MLNIILDLFLEKDYHSKKIPGLLFNDFLIKEGCELFPLTNVSAFICNSSWKW